MTASCGCAGGHEPRRVVLTGGPGAGKTALLELIRAAFCVHVRVLPEAAGIVFGGGFPRGEGVPQRRAAQRAIFHVQRELEAIGEAEDAAVVLCDRGTLDGLAYWPGDPDEFWSAVHSDPATELARYTAVIHLHTPASGHGYNRDNPVRTESAEVAAAIDVRIASAWAAHPRVFTVAATEDFMGKVETAMTLLRRELPACCRAHHLAADEQRV